MPLVAPYTVVYFGYDCVPVAAGVGLPTGGLLRSQIVADYYFGKRPDFTPPLTLRQTPSVSRAALVHELLQWHAHPFVIEQGRADVTGRRDSRFLPSDPGRTAPSICPDLICGRHSLVIEQSHLPAKKTLDPTTSSVLFHRSRCLVDRAGSGTEAHRDPA